MSSYDPTSGATEVSPGGQHAGSVDTTETAGTTGSGGSGGTRSLGEIVGDITTDLSTLMKQEVELAKVELKTEVARAGKGAGMLAGAGVAGHLVLVFVSLTFLFLLDTFMAQTWAALITTAVWAVIAAVLALAGRAALKKAQPQLPTTQQTLKEDAQWVRAQKS